MEELTVESPLSSRGVGPWLWGIVAELLNECPLVAITASVVVAPSDTPFSLLFSPDRGALSVSTQFPVKFRSAAAASSWLGGEAADLPLPPLSWAAPLRSRVVLTKRPKMDSGSDSTASSH